MLKKLLGLLLAICLALSAASVSLAEEVAYPLSDEKINISYLFPFTPNGRLESLDEMMMFGAMEELTNVHLDFITTTDVITQFNLMVSAGEMPDIAFIKALELPNGVASYIEDGTILALNDYMQYAPNLSKVYEEHPEWLKAMTLEDGSIYGIPKIKSEHVLLNTQGLEIRQDWLDRLGLQVPTTIDEWDAVLKAFKEQDANGNGDANDEIPFSCIALSNLGQERSFLGVFALGYGLTDTFCVKDGKVLFSPYQNEFKDLLTKLNEWYAKGYIDADYLTNDADVLGAKMTSNIAGSTMHHLNHGMAKFLAAWAAEGLTEYNIVGTPYPMAPDGNVYSHATMPEVGVVSLVLTSANQHPKETMQYFDYYFSEAGKILYNYGIEGLSYTMVDGKPQYTEDVTNNPDGYAASTAIQQYCFGLGDYPGMQIGAVFTETSRWPQQKAAYDLYAASTPINLLNITHSADESSYINKYWGDINTYTIEMINKFIMGTEPLDKFEEFQANLKNLHIEEITQYKQDAYERSLN